MSHEIVDTSPEDLARAVLAALPNGVLAVDAAGTIVGSNPAADEMFGYGRGALTGRPLSILIPQESREAHPALRERFLRRPERMTMSPGREVRAVRADGSTFPVDVLLSPAEGGSGIVVALVTAQKALEERQREAETESHRRQRLETVGTLIAGIAHDFNNLLVPILTFAELLEDDVTPAGAEALRHLQASALSGRDICTQILEMSRGSTPASGAFRPAKSVESAVHFVQMATPSRIRVQAWLDDAGGAVMGDPSRLEQIVMNLCTNAAQAIGDGAGTVTVALGRAESLIPGGRPQFVLSVEDDGPGIPNPVRERMFEPFFTTRSASGGTGLGLSVVEGIVKRHRGSIELVDRQAPGARFEVVLPAVEPSPEEGDSEAVREPVPPRDGKDE